MSREIAEIISQGEGFLGIEFGSTRIKAVLIDDNHNPIASGAHNWENQLENGHWTYSEQAIWQGLQLCFKHLCDDVKEKYHVTLKSVKAIGVSAMMHGYMAFDAQGELLVPFRTWRNTNTGEAAEALTKLFDFNIPLRWSVAHLYQAILNGESHVENIAYLTTLAGFIHWKLTGEKVLGVGDASGMFPIDSETNDYDLAKLSQFQSLVDDKGYALDISAILPKVLVAGQTAGRLTKAGALLLDPTGEFSGDIPFCPPEGDAGTGMVATNAVAERTGNVSAGTSIFAMVVLEKALKKQYAEIDMVTTPSGKPVAMVHCNNCTSDINAWAGVFGQFLQAIGQPADMNLIYTAMFESALKGDKDCGEVLSYNYFSGEPITGLDEGRPLLVRMPNSNFTFENMMKSLLLSALATLKLGMNILEKEQVKVDRLLGHGGFFKTAIPAQRFMAAALQTPITLMTSAGEGGPWGMAILAAYMASCVDNAQKLEAYLDDVVFAGNQGDTLSPVEADVISFNQYIQRYTNGLAIEKVATEVL